MLPPTPPWLATKYAFTGLKVAIAASLMLFGVVGCSVQTVRLDGLQLKLPLIGAIGPQGWKPYAQELEGKVKTIRVQLDQSEANHAATKKAYRDAQAEAEKMEVERLARVLAQQERITDEVRDDYNRRIATLRARADRLREEARARAGGAPGSVPVPAASDPASGADEAPGCAGLSGTRDPLTQIECDRIATEQAMQLDALITWVQRQLGVAE